MAKVKPSVIISDIRGTAGNIVFQKSPEGLIAREHVEGTNPKTPAQLAVRAAFRTSAQTYAGFDAATHAKWVAYADRFVLRDPITGETRKQSPFNAFTKLGVKFLLVTPGGTLPTTPPAAAFPGDAITVTASAGTGKVTFTASGPNAANVVTEFLLQPLANANRKPQKNGYRSKGFFAFVPGTLTHDVTVPTGFYAAGYRFVNTATGQEIDMIPLPIQQVAFSVAGGKTDKKAA